MKCAKQAAHRVFTGRALGSSGIMDAMGFFVRAVVIVSLLHGGCGEDSRAVDSVEDVAVDSVEDVAVDSGEDVAVDSVEDVAVDSGEDVAVDSVEDVAVDSVEDVAVDSVEDVAVDSGGTTTATGRVTRDDRAVSADRTALGPVVEVPVAGLALSVRAAGVELGRGVTDADGVFAIDVARADGPLELVFAATADADGELALAILDSDGVAVPSRPGVGVHAARLWTWVAAPIAGGDFGTVHVREADGAGALALIAHLGSARARARQVFGPGGGALAVLWSPTRTPSCLSCFVPRTWGPITLDGAEPRTFDTGIFLSGAPAAPHHFTPSLAAHELGHWLLDTWSRPPEAGGTHGWLELVAPPLAWSEGFATFFAQWALSGEGPEPRFFSMQQNVQYWVDLEAVGHGDAASFAADFPAPSPGGGLAQRLDEAVVAAILWDLYDDATNAADEDVVLADGVTAAVGSPRFDLDRGVPEPDLVDLIDALACLGARDFGAALHGFPWDSAPLCP